MGNVCDRRNRAEPGPGYEALRREAAAAKLRAHEGRIRVLSDCGDTKHGIALAGAAPQWGAPSQLPFADKPMDSVGNPAAATTRFAVRCKKGRKGPGPNQDDFFVVHTDTVRIFGVLDGHGSEGHLVSQFVNEELPGLLVRRPEFQLGNVEESIVQALLEVHEDLEGVTHMPYGKRLLDASLSGTTCAVLVLKDSRLYVGSVGDSRVVLGRSRGSKFVAEELVRDHKPDLADEYDRILASGGDVRVIPGDVASRIYVRGLHYPGLAMSRSLGDLEAHKVGCSAEAETCAIQVTPEMKFVVLASDGVWDFLTSQEVVTLVSRYPRSEVETAAEALCREAYRRWNANGSIIDDITAIVVWL